MGMGRGRWWVVAAALGVGGGCMEREIIRPAPGAQQVKGDEWKAISTVEGVTVTVDGKAWDGTPRVIQGAEPVKLTLRNESTQPLRVRLRDISLRTTAGAELAALPPILIDSPAVALGADAVAEQPVYGGSGYPLYEPGFVGTGYGIAGAWSPYYDPGLDVWDGPFEYDSPYYLSNYRRWYTDLPTEDMIEKAIPEGVLRPGGTVDGFVYFEEIPVETRRLTFQMELVNANTGERFGDVEIPFESAQ